MADQPQSPELREALSKGAEIGFARALAGGFSEQAVKDFTQARLGNLTPDEIAEISDLAKAIIAAGESFSVLQDDELPDPDSIPTNDNLFGADFGGKRLFWFGEWNIPGTDKWYQFSGTLPDLTSPDAIKDYAGNLAMDYIEAYPKKFPGADEMKEGELPNVRILGQEKAF